MEINNPNDAVKYLKDNWSGEFGGPITTIELLINNSGYFEIPHLLLTYIEYLSGLFCGKGPKVKYTDIRHFFSTYFPPQYQKASAWLIYLYRHGLVHEYTPKTISVNSAIKISWFCSLDSTEIKNHLKILPSPDNKSDKYHLRICASEFLKDFKNSINIFCNDILNNSDRFLKFQSGFKAYNKVEDIANINKPYINQDDKNWLTNF
jgi:hypothetical protein